MKNVFIALLFVLFSVLIVLYLLREKKWKVNKPAK